MTSLLPDDDLLLDYAAIPKTERGLSRWYLLTLFALPTLVIACFLVVILPVLLQNKPSHKDIWVVVFMVFGQMALAAPLVGICMSLPFLRRNGQIHNKLLVAFVLNVGTLIGAVIFWYGPP